MGSSDLFTVTVEFEQSHLFFPHIIHWLLLVLFLLVVAIEGVPYVREVRAGTKTLPFTSGHFDSLRFFGTIVLTVAYFLSMQYVGEFFPNTGFGFLFMSIPYMFALSWLYLHRRDRRHLMMTTINALLAPIIAWYVLAQLFSITLP